MKKLLALIAMAAVILIASIAFGQELAAEPETVSDGAKLGLSIYEMMIPLILGGLTFLGAQLSKFIKTKTKNSMLGGILVRLNESVFESVKAVNQQMKDLIGKAKDPSSPGGVEITKAEAEQLKKAALDHVKSYWGAKGLGEMAGVLGFGGDMLGLDKMLTNKIEAAVGTMKEKSKDPK